VTLDVLGPFEQDLDLVAGRSACPHAENWPWDQPFGQEADVDDDRVAGQVTTRPSRSHLVQMTEGLVVERDELCAPSGPPRSRFHRPVRSFSVNAMN
jgi:hypothetical protein